MKHTKRFLALCLLTALLMSVCSMSVFADETSSTDPTYNFVVENNVQEGYTYLLYEMLTGDIAVNEEGKQVLSNVDWGNGVKEKSKTAMYTMAGLTGANQTAAKFAEWLSGQGESVFHQMMAQVQSNNGESLQNPQTLVYGSYSINGTNVYGYGKTGLKGGYYLVRNTAVPTGETFSDYIVFVLNQDTKMNPKSAPSPTPEKKVTDKNDSYPSEPTLNATQDSADYDIGDSIPYTLRILLPSNYTSYTSYKLVFKDEMSKGLTYNNDAKIYFGVKDEDGTSISFVETGSSTIYPDNGKTYTYTIENLKVSAYDKYSLTDNSPITIKYTATLNKNAVVGSVGNPNAFTVDYSNNPTGTSTGTSEPDVTTVFTFKLVFNKVDKAGNALTGADFDLYKLDESVAGTDKWIKVENLGSGDNKPLKTKSGSGSIEDCIFTFSGLDDGKYKLHESVTPAGYNSIDDIEFTVTAVHDTDSATPTLTGLTGTNGTTFAMTQNLADGSLSANIVNESGSVLPTTGAGGTAFLAMAGTMLAFAGIVALVTIRRMLAA